MCRPPGFFSTLFFFNDTATTEIYTLSLHDALPTCGPLPWLITSSCSSATGARASQAVRTLARWLSTVIGSPRRCRALPPRATTTRMTVILLRVDGCRRLSTAGPNTEFDHSLLAIDDRTHDADPSLV